MTATGYFTGETELYVKSMGRNFRVFAILEDNKRAVKKANAMIAAPDLLEACEFALAFAENRDAERSTIGSRKIIDRIKDAIAKAEGKE